jgi:hypothetical protein
LTPGGAFAVQRFNLNPLNPALFPWLSTVAQNFEQYRILGCIVEFKTNSATAVASTNTALGSVIIATQYNALDRAFTNKQQMEQYQYCVSTVPSVSCIHPIECDPSLRVEDILYTDNESQDGDARFSNMGVVNIATVGQQAASNLGELWISYEIELINPRMVTIIPDLGNFFHGFAIASQGAAVVGGVVANLFFQTSLPQWTLSNGNTVPLIAKSSDPANPNNLDTLYFGNVGQPINGQYTLYIRALFTSANPSGGTVNSGISSADSMTVTSNCIATQTLHGYAGAITATASEDIVFGVNGPTGSLQYYCTWLLSFSVTSSPFSFAFRPAPRTLGTASLTTISNLEMVLTQVSAT